MRSNRLTLLTALPLVLAFALDLRAEDWAEEALTDAGVPDVVRDATLDYGQTGDFERTRVIYEGTLERFPFGHRQATLICAPLRICSIVLEDGESVLDVLLGDTQHWQTFDLTTGPAASTPIVAVRPMVDFEFSETCDKTTNLVITTDRRIYDVLLELPPCAPGEASDPNPHRPYHRQLSFYYPDDLLERWRSRAELRAIQAEARAAQETLPQPTALAPEVGVEGLNWRYRVRSERSLKPFKRSPRFPWRPRAVFDDGVRTYVKLPPEARELPAIFEVSGGDDVVVNFTPAADDPSLLILPRVAEHLVLVLPRGERRARLHLLNEAAP
jgi:type IV secretion system protein VirB9